MPALKIVPGSKRNNVRSSRFLEMLRKLHHRGGIARIMQTAAVLLFCVLYSGCRRLPQPPSNTFSSQDGSLSVQTAILIDTGGLMQSDALQQAEAAGRFVPVEPGSPHFSWSTAAYWLRVQIHNQSFFSQSRYLILDYQFIDSLDIFLDTGAVPLHSGRAGRHIPVIDRTEKFCKWTVPLSFAPDEQKTVYLRIRSSEVLTLPLILKTPKVFNCDFMRLFFFYGLFYGVAGVSLLLVLFMYIFTRDRSYIYYGGMILFTDILFTLGRQGLSSIYLFPKAPLFASLAHLSFSAVGQIFTLFLCRSLLRYKFPNAFLKRVFQVQIFLLAVNAVLPFLVGYTAGSRMLHVITGLSILLVLFMSVHRAVQGYRPAVFLSIAWLFHLMGAVTILLNSFGVLTNLLIANHGFQTGLLVEKILIAISIAYGVSLQRRKKILAQKKTLQAHRRVIKQLQKTREAKVKEMQAKIKPHFLFNVLNSISHIVQEHPERAENAIEKLSDFYRQTLSISEKKLISLEEEAEVNRLYLSLQQIRFQDRLKFTVTIPPEAKDVLVPGFLIQPLVENAVKHGIFPKKEGGTVDVTAEIENGECRITVADNGVGWGTGPSSSGHGLINVQERLKLIYGKNYQLKIISRHGVTIQITIPAEV